MEQKIFTTREAAEYITAKVLPSASKPLTPRSVARMCKLGRVDGAYMAQGDWCVPQNALDTFVEKTLATKGRPPRKRKDN
jgi:hypothetical protein